MKSIQLSFLLLTAIFSSSHQLSKPEDPTYTAAVVEHSQPVGDSPRTRTTSASESFQKIIREVGDVDIIVFPEHIINSQATATFVPHESQNITPCYQTDYELFLIELSCSARANQLYVVINVVEKELCAHGAGSDTYNPCPSTGVRSPAPRRTRCPPCGAKSYRYRIGVYWGNETTVIGVDRTEQATCALFACTDVRLASCGYIYPENEEVINTHHFTKLSISGNFPAAPRGRRLIMPSTLNALFLPVSVADYEWIESPEAANNVDKPILVDLKLEKPQNDLLTFAIWANYYTEIPSTHNLDHMQPNGTQTSPSTSSSSTVSVFRILCVLSCLISVL
ncbi:GM12588 [Drosophila sechellia]|uniref:GM12588 n=1 Tax=Drosophila sechellia TaxID=7238 RepID=B4I0E2_DROSE|nr:GM12588 [Drosophila sechellia]